MKYSVIGWTDYDNLGFEDEGTTDAAMFAIIDDIRAHGYIFSGREHQENMGCAPVLNDGKRRCFSQRTFGAVMALAKECYGAYDYSHFAFGFPPEKCLTPARERWITPEEAAEKTERELHESFRIHVSENELYMAVAMRALGLPDVPALRYADCGDTVVLVSPKKERTLTLEAVERTRDSWGELPFSTLTLKFSPDKE